MEQDDGYEEIMMRIVDRVGCGDRCVRDMV